MTEAFVVNEPMVISEIIDDEAVVIDLDKGSYYSLRNSAAVVWAGIQASAPLAEIAAAVRSAFDTGDASVEEDVTALLSSLADEGLVRPADAVSGFAFASGSGRMYEAPAFEKFTDMEAMLLLDPVHDVDEAGWPHKS